MTAASWSSSAGRGALQTGPNGPPEQMYREPHVASRVSGHHASPRGDAARDIQNATRPIYNKARGAEDGTPTSCLFPHSFLTRSPTSHMSPPPAHRTSDKSRDTYHTHLLVPPSARRPKRRKPTHSAHLSPDARPHTPRRRTRALPLIGLSWCAVAAAHLHAIYILRRLYRTEIAYR